MKGEMKKMFKTKLANTFQNIEGAVDYKAAADKLNQVLLLHGLKKDNELGDTLGELLSADVTFSLICKKYSDSVIADLFSAVDNLKAAQRLALITKTR